MLVLTFFMYIIFNMNSASGKSSQIENKYILSTSSNLETVTRVITPGPTILNYTENISSTETYEKPTTNTNKEKRICTEPNVVSPISYFYGMQKEQGFMFPKGENSVQLCLPGQSAYKKKDLKSIIDIFILQQNVSNGLNDSFYPKAMHVRNMYIEHLKIFAKKFEDRPRHLKHILQDMAFTRQSMEPMIKRFASLLNQFQSYEMSYRTTEEKVNNILEYLEKSKKICNLNCDYEDVKSLITMTSSRRFLNANHVYCSTFDELITIIVDGLTKFFIEYSDNLDIRLNKDFIIFSAKIINIKNKLKVAAVEQFGLTMYEILMLQDEYYHFAIDLKHYNISNVLQEIKQNEYEINSKLLKLESEAKVYRDYCNTCNDRMVYTVRASGQRLPRAVKIESQSLLDEVLNETMNNIQISFGKQYDNIFEELNRKLDETTIIEAHLSKLKPIKGEIDEDIKKETVIFEQLQRSVPKSSIDRVFQLADRSKLLLRRVEDGLFFIREHIQ